MRNLFTVVMMFMAFWATSQTNPSNISKKLVKGETLNISLFTNNGKPVTNSTIIASAINNPDRNSYDITFRSDELGHYTDVFKYSENGIAYYTTINIEVVESILTTDHDYQEIGFGEIAIIDVLSNDQSTAGGLDVTSIPYVQNGTAEILNGFIQFIPESGFSGLAYLNYVVTDEMGESETGFVTINVADVERIRNIDVINDAYFVQIGEIVDIVIPPDMRLDDFGATSLGKLNALGNGVLRFRAGQNSGIQKVPYLNGGQSESFDIYIFDIDENHGFIRDDIIYTTMGQSVTFDVFLNDLEKTYSLVDKSPELKLVSPNTGLLLYNPPQGFQGVETFYYEVSDGTNSYIGNINIVVNDNLPQTRVYEFVTRENTRFLLEHVSATGGEINFIQAPVNGILRLQENGFFYCGGQVFGNNFIVYDPHKGFTGTDQFEVEYCSGSGACVTLEVVMTVEASTNDCECIGSDCVWPGDADGDGIVTVKDLLPIGYYMGESGPVRSESGSQWNALESINWGETLAAGTTDIKNVDSNGDGQIDINDVEVLNENFALLHSFLSSEALSIKNVPFYAVPRELSGSAGDLITIDLYVGSEENPLLESNGLAFNFVIPSVYILDNSLEFIFSPELWFGYNNPTINTVQYPTTGRVEAGLSRTGGSAVDGFGRIGTFRIVLQEDHEGFKPESGKLPIEIEINGGQYINGTGNKYGLQDSKTTIYLDLNDQNIEKEIEIITFPNPAADRLTIHANNQDEIQNINVYNTIGQSIELIRNIQSNHYELNTSALPEGFYMARVETLFGVSVEKIQIVRE